MNRTKRNIIGILLGILIILVVWSMFNNLNRRENLGNEGQLGLQEYEEKNYQKAAEHYTRALEENPENPYLHNNLGLALHAERKYDEAIAEFSKAIELKPDFSKAYFNRGQTNWRKGGYNDTEFLDRAVDDFTTVIEMDPDDMDACYNRALAYSTYMHWHKKKKAEGHSMQSGFTPEATMYFVRALVDFQKVIDSNSAYSALAVAGRANLFYRHAEWDLAIMEYKKALERRDEIIALVGKDHFGGIYAPMGRTYMALGDMKNAYLSYASFMELVPNPLETFHRMGLSVGIGYALYTAKDQKQYAKAVEWYDKRITLSEEPSASDYFDKGFCQYQLKRFDDAIKTYNEGLDIYGRTTKKNEFATSEADARRYLGMIYKEKGDPAEATTAFRKAVALYSEKEKGQQDNGNASAQKGKRPPRVNYDGRGACYLELGEYEKAIADFGKIQKSPMRPQAYILAQKNIGIAYEKMGRTDEARNYFEKTIELANELEKEKERQEILRETEKLLKEMI